MSLILYFMQLYLILYYAIPAFSGFLSEYNRSRINSVYKKGRKWRITDLSLDKFGQRYGH